MTQAIQPQLVNDLLVLVAGKSSTGKSASLRNLKNPGSVMYLNCEAGKRLPFPAKFKYNVTVTNPLQIEQAFNKANEDDEINVVIIDTLTFLLDMYVSQFVKTAADGRKAWGDFAEYFRKMMQEQVATCKKTVIFLAHTLDTYNESQMITETYVPVAGSLKNQGIEAWFSTVIATKKIKVTEDLKEHDTLKITDRERNMGMKYVFQCQLTRETVNERIRAPLMLFGDHETYTDNDLQIIIDRLQAYYA